MSDFAQTRTAETKFGYNMWLHKALDTSQQHLMKEAPPNSGGGRMMPAKAHVYETTPQIKNGILLALSKLEYERLLHIAADSVCRSVRFPNSVS